MKLSELKQEIRGIDNAAINIRAVNEKLQWLLDMQGNSKRDPDGISMMIANICCSISLVEAIHIMTRHRDKLVALRRLMLANIRAEDDDGQ